MYAKVKNIKVGSEVGDERYVDEFTTTMARKIGKRIKVELQEYSKNWYVGYINLDNMKYYYNFHKSWLTIEKPKKKTTKKKATG